MAMPLLPIRRQVPSWKTHFGEEHAGGVFLDRLWNEWTSRFCGEWVPTFNLSEKKGNYILTAELPGVDKDSISITIDSDMLTISGRKESVHEEEGALFHMKECFSGAFSRSVRLPVEVQEDQAGATFRDGVLILVMPQKETQKNKKIEIK
jgi:HSP20 family protein